MCKEKDIQKQIDKMYRLQIVHLVIECGLVVMIAAACMFVIINIIGG